MQKRDFRSLNQETQAELRRLALAKISKGFSKQFVADMVEVNVQTIADWMRKRTELEARDFMGELRGRKEGEHRILTDKEELRIKELIVKQTPEELNLGAALWTRRKIQELIKKETKHKFPLNTVGNHLHRWGLTPQRPGKRAYEQDDEKIRKWTQEEYPDIVKKANKEKAIIKFSDETGISLNTYYGKSYALKGKTPSIKLPSLRTHISMISSISRSGLLEFTLYRKGLDSDKFIDFLEKQIKNQTSKIYLIVDNLRVHKSKKVLDWQKKHTHQIELFFPTSLCTTIQSS